MFISESIDVKRAPDLVRYRQNEKTPMSYLKFLFLTFFLWYQPFSFSNVQTQEDDGDPQQIYFYSDALGMINGLLRYEHQSFSDNDLDIIEEALRKLVQ